MHHPSTSLDLPEVSARRLLAYNSGTPDAILLGTLGNRIRGIDGHN